MWASVTIKSAGALPLSAEELRDRLRIDTAAEDDLLAAFLAAGASEIDGPDGAGVAMMAQTWTRTLDGWAQEIVLPGWPVTGVSEIRYLDPEGNQQTLAHAAAFRVVLGRDPARLVRKPGAPLPALLSGPGVVEVDYTLGRTDAAEVDAGLVAALALLAGHFYENREATAPGQVVEVPLGARHILDRFRRGVVA
ncbi:hypothetical protein ETW23_03870 [Leisingera sp. NJS201]|uniref:head-tail connector protein n=1 Tax=Leisingera sp. NJS201 TaxID=2508306 RepID=UPI0010709C01|nr:hypothetical protein [Leisingera sp. NJS201]QBR35404.1 hypothetical protein ETW23_03870 [Leisingera sp. NJS201]